MPRSWRLAGGRGPGVPLAVGPSPSITGVPTQDFSRKRARRNTPAEHHLYKLSPHCTPPLEPCERGKKGRPQAAACSPPLSNGTRGGSARVGLPSPRKKQKVWEETRLPARSHSTATSVGQSTSGEGFCLHRDHLEVCQGKKKELTREEESNSHTHTHALLTAGKNLTHPTTSFI